MSSLGRGGVGPKVRSFFAPESITGGPRIRSKFNVISSPSSSIPCNKKWHGKMAITSAKQSSCLLRGQTQPGAEAAASSTVRCLIIDHYRLKVNLNTEVGERNINCHWSFGVGIGSEPGPHPLGDEDDRYVIENAMRESFGASQTFPSSSSSAVGASIRSSFGP